VTATLALGIGATTALFSVVNGVLLRELPTTRPSGSCACWAPRMGSLRARAR
jgi:hypothetical protein